MTKQAAHTDSMSSLHDKLAQVFTRVLKNYETRLDAIDSGDLEADILAAIDAEPSPAMLKAVASFLKDNNISYDDGAIEGLNAQQESLERRKKARGNLTVLTELRAVGDD